VLGPKIVQQTTKEDKMIQERVKASQSSQKNYHVKQRKSLEFQEGDHVFWRITLVTDVGGALKSNKLTPCFIGRYQIIKRVGEVAFQVSLPLSLSNLHSVLYVSQLRKYVPDPSNIIQMGEVQVRDNLTVEALPLRIKDREEKI